MSGLFVFLLKAISSALRVSSGLKDGNELSNAVAQLISIFQSAREAAEGGLEGELKISVDKATLSEEKPVTHAHLWLYASTLNLRNHSRGRYV
jgi:hypothetical protein